VVIQALNNMAAAVRAAMGAAVSAAVLRPMCVGVFMTISNSSLVSQAYN